MPFVKLDCGILNSTIWVDRLARELFITSLLMAEPRELIEAMPQITVGQLEYTGWSIPPGWYGFVEAAGPGIIARAGLEDRGPLFTAAMEALTRLGDPEPDSRSHAFDGRRLVRVDGGFVVLNYIQYREKDSTAAERSRRWRERQKAKALRVTDTPIRVIRHQAEEEGEVQVQAEVRTEAAPPPARPMAPIHDNSHRKHAHCGRVCLPAALFGEFVRRRNHDKADAEIRDWALEVEREWSSKPDEPGDAYEFWKARYSERWPTATTDKRLPAWARQP